MRSKTKKFAFTLYLHKYRHTKFLAGNHGNHLILVFIGMKLKKSHHTNKPIQIPIRPKLNLKDKVKIPNLMNTQITSNPIQLAYFFLSGSFCPRTPCTYAKQCTLFSFSSHNNKSGDRSH